MGAPVLVVLIAVAAAVAAICAVVVLFVLMIATGTCCVPVQKCFSRYVVRGMLKRSDEGLEFNYTQLDELLFMGRLPKQTAQLSELREKHGVSALVTLNETWELPSYIAIAGVEGKDVVSTKDPTTAEPAPPELEDPDSFSFCHLPTPDYCAPRQVDIWRGVRWMQERHAAGQAVYVHCNAGRGRSAVVVLCFLILTKGLSADEALQFVAELRDIANLKALCGTRPQWRAVLKFERALVKQQTLRPPHKGKKNQVAPMPKDDASSAPAASSSKPVEP